MVLQAVGVRVRGSEAEGVKAGGYGGAEAEDAEGGGGGGGHWWWFFGLGD